jgi:hypothetical protein
LGDQVFQLVAATVLADYRKLVMSKDGDGDVAATNSISVTSSWTTGVAQFANDNDKLTNQRPDVNLTSIAMIYNGTFYGITVNGSQIVEYFWTLASRSFWLGRKISPYPEEYV